jgi:hypothetical protein
MRSGLTRRLKSSDPRFPSPLRTSAKRWGRGREVNYDVSCRRPNLELGSAAPRRRWIRLVFRPG